MKSLITDIYNIAQPSLRSYVPSWLSAYWESVSHFISYWFGRPRWPNDLVIDRLMSELYEEFGQDP